MRVLDTDELVRVLRLDHGEQQENRGKVQGGAEEDVWKICHKQQRGRKRKSVTRESWWFLFYLYFFQ